MGLKIGRVYEEDVNVKGQLQKYIKLDIRTITQRKKLTITPNTSKASGEDYDYFVWHNPSSRGESVMSDIVGGIFEKDGVMTNGMIFDPFVPNGKIAIEFKTTRYEHMFDVLSKQ
jgi:hypothetical protein